MKTSRWKPLPADVMGAARELAEQLRVLVDRHGLTLRRLAAADDVPYDLAALRQFFSGRVLPPRQLVELIAERCGGDRELLLSTLDRAVAARDAGLPWAAAAATPAPRRSLRDRPRLFIAALIGLAVGTNVLTAVVVVRLADGSASAGAGTRTRPPQPAGPTSSGVPTSNSTPAEASPLPTRGKRPAPLKTSGSLIRNGTFTGTTTSWWPVSEVRITPDADRLRADVRGGSTEPWQRIVSAASFPLRSGRTYTLTFDAAANADITDRVTVELDYQPYTEALSRRIELTTSMRRFSYRFTANLTAEQALNFELGDHRADHTIWLDNVTLAPAS